jgi:integrase
MAANSLMHVRALMSGIFAHAVGEGRLDVNPIRDAKRREETKPSRPTEHYSLIEIVSILRALEGHLDAQLAIALGYFGGMRTAEISGLQWGDISNDWSSIALAPFGKGSRRHARRKGVKELFRSQNLCVRCCKSLRPRKPSLPKCSTCL